jgi:hypothetical protein
MGLNFPLCLRATGLLALFRAFVLRLGLLAHAESHGDQRPVRLLDLTPAILPRLPVDPFSGKDLGYNATAGFVYSVGPDRVDDGGSPESGWFDFKHGQSGKDDLTMVVRSTRVDGP